MNSFLTFNLKTSPTKTSLFLPKNSDRKKIVKKIKMDCSFY